MTAQDEADESPLLSPPDLKEDGCHGEGSKKDYLYIKESEVPRQAQTTCLVYTLTFFSSLGGFLLGYHCAVISGAMILIKEDFHLNNVWQEVVVSVTIGGAILFSVVSGYTSDRLGRKSTMLAAAAICIFGSVIQAVAQNIGHLIAGRLIVGFGTGLVSTASPLYIAEASPVYLRGPLITVNTLFISVGQLAANIVAGFFSFDHLNGWRYMVGLAGVPSLVMLIGLLFLPESPQWLISTEQEDKARSVLCKLRGTNDIEEELKAIKHFQKEQALQKQSSEGFVSVVLRMLRTRHVLKALVVGCSLHVIQLISAVGIVLSYNATIIKMAGVRDSSVAIWLSTLTFGVKAVFTCVGAYIIDRVDRRPLLVISLIGTFCSLCVLAVGFQLAAVSSPAVNHEATSALTNSSCSQYSSCDSCVQENTCGFCYDETIGLTTGGLCLPVLVNRSAAVLPCGPGQAVPGWSWVHDFCPTSYPFMAPVGLILFLAFYSSGLAILPWTYNTEIYPSWAISTGNGLANAFHWIFTLFTCFTFLSLTEVISRQGVFWLYAGFTFAGTLFVVAFMPETRWKTSEEVEESFKKPWC